MIIPSLDTFFKTVNASPRDSQPALAVSKAYTDREEYGMALEWADRATALDSQDWRCHERRGAVLKKLNRLPEAYQAYATAANIPSRPCHIWHELADLCMAAGEHPVAEQHLIQAIRLNPMEVSNYEHLTKILVDRLDADEALIRGQEYLAGFGDGIYLQRAMVRQLISRGRHEDAECMMEQQLCANGPSFAFDEALAEIARQRRYTKTAGQHYLRWLQANPADDQAQLCYMGYLLSIGDIDRARSIARVAFAGAGTQEQSVMTPSSLDKRTVLLEFKKFDGYGDAIQFLRFSRQLSESGAKVIVISRPRIAGLMATIPGIDQVILPHDDCPEVDCVVDGAVLWMLLDDDLTRLGGYVPYVRPKLRSLPQLHRLSAQRCNVGILWQCGRQAPSNPFTTRSLPLSCLEPLSRIPGIRLFSLQAGPSRSELLRTDWENPIVDLDQGTSSFEECALMISAMDLIITVDTGPAHLAGALGIPVFLMLPYAPEWRWMVDGSDSPWYPTMRLFRQESPGDWDTVVSRVAAALVEFAPQLSPEPPVLQSAGSRQPYMDNQV
jgi:tetratricopeptide (TPR) repeat protein